MTIHLCCNILKQLLHGHADLLRREFTQRLELDLLRRLARLPIEHCLRLAYAEHFVNATNPSAGWLGGSQRVAERLDTGLKLLNRNGFLGSHGD